MSLNDYIESDLSIFINNDEFGELHKIDGVDKCIVIDNERLEEISKSKFQGMSAGEILYSIPISEYGSQKPHEYNTQYFDGKLMYITHVGIIEGMYEIALSMNRGE